MSYKGRLNEYCQKNGHCAPKYETYRTGGLAHTPIFDGKITLWDGKTYAVQGFPNKKQVENELAKLVVDFLKKVNNIERVKSGVNEYLPVEKRNIKRLIMIDGENKHKIADKIGYNLYEHVILYYSRNHDLVNRPCKPYISKMISPSTRSNGCDIFMVMDLMKRIERYPVLTDVSIITSDKFASSVVDNMKYFYPKLNVTHDTKYKDYKPE